MSKNRFNSPEDFGLLASTYFQQCVENRKRPTVAGLTMALGLHSYKSLQRYREDEAFAAYHPVANRAYMYIMDFYEQGLMDKNVNVAGPIFGLKSLFGLSDKQPGEKSDVHIKISGVDAKI